MTPKEQIAYDEAKAEIEACRKSGETSLVLSDMGLIAVPPEIGQLSALIEVRNLESTKHGFFSERSTGAPVPLEGAMCWVSQPGAMMRAALEICWR